MFFRNVGWLSTDYTALYPRRLNSSASRVVATCLCLVACLAYSSTLKMETVNFSETSIDMYQTSRRHVSAGSNLYVMTYCVSHTVATRKVRISVRVTTCVGVFSLCIMSLLLGFLTVIQIQSACWHVVLTCHSSPFLSLSTHLIHPFHVYFLSHFISACLCMFVHLSVRCQFIVFSFVCFPAY
jgi:hypothetical protein